MVGRHAGVGHNGVGDVECAASRVQLTWKVERRRHLPQVRVRIRVRVRARARVRARVRVRLSVVDTFHR